MHTPGPWHDAEGSHGHYVAVKASTGRTIARVSWGENDAANARLIAAAPDLLALIRAWALSDPHGTHSDGSITRRGTL
jgi:hypothetical protein